MSSFRGKGKGKDDPTPPRAKSSLGFHHNRSSSGGSGSGSSSRADLPKRSQTPSVGSSSRHSDKERRKKKHKKVMDTIADEDEEDGGAPVDDGYGTMSRQGVFEDNRPLRYNSTVMPDLLNPATADFSSRSEHGYWKWSKEKQDWYHKEADGSITWAGPLG